jgi:hypothetical protein
MITKSLFTMNLLLEYILGHLSKFPTRRAGGSEWLLQCNLLQPISPEPSRILEEGAWKTPLVASLPHLRIQRCTTVSIHSIISIMCNHLSMDFLNQRSDDLLSRPVGHAVDDSRISNSSTSCNLHAPFQCLLPIIPCTAVISQ